MLLVGSNCKVITQLSAPLAEIGRGKLERDTPPLCIVLAMLDMLNSVLPVSVILDMTSEPGPELNSVTVCTATSLPGPSLTTFPKAMALVEMDNFGKGGVMITGVL